MISNNIIFHKEMIPSNEKNLELSAVFMSPLEPLGLVQIVHGMCEHKERYIHFMNFIVKNGYACVIHDNRGHGESVLYENDLGYFYDSKKDGFMDDIARTGEFGLYCFNIVRQMNLNGGIDDEKLTSAFSKFDYSVIFDDLFKNDDSFKPISKRHLFGHSMGSLAVRAYAAENDDELLSLTVCGSPSNNPASGIAVFLAEAIGFFCGEKHHSKLLERVSTGAFEKKFPGDDKTAWLSTNKEYRDQYRDPAKCDFNFTANGYATLFKLLNDVYNPAKWDVTNKNLPVMFISGADDPCAVDEKHFSDAVQFIRDIGYKDVSSKIYPGMRHEILNETGRETVYSDILDFLNQNNNII